MTNTNPTPKRWLYHPAEPAGRIFEGDAIDRALADGWKKSPADLPEPVVVSTDVEEEARRLKSLSEELATLEEHLEARESTLIERERALGESTEQASALLDEREADLKKREEMLADETTAALDAAIKEREDASARSASLNEREAELDALAKVLEERAQLADAREAELAKAEEAAKTPKKKGGAKS